MMGFDQVGGYDRIATMFSPDGRIHQIEYAKEAVKHGSLVIVGRVKEGIIMISEQKEFNKLILPNEKINQIDEGVFAAYSGLLSDAKVLVERIRVEAQVQRLYYKEDPDINVIAWNLGTYMQQLLQRGMRPFGVSLILAGYDRNGTEVHLIEPSGAKFECKAIAIGNNDSDVMKELEEKYKDDMSLEELEKMILEIAKNHMEEKKVEYLKINRASKEITREIKTLE
ncbi:MAG: proteasome subunit alpha [Candidatus Lokiarchaeota archaeon]|nr:proteasome subunit alpha [Candidatus Lokiarchaeota archaeon]